MKVSELGNTPFYIDGWKVLPRQNRLTRAGKDHSVEPKVMQVLVCLARNAPEPVSRATLFEEVWDGNFVSEDVLSRSISILRGLFGDDPKQPSFIETIPKYGYALMVEPTLGREISSRKPVIDVTGKKYKFLPILLTAAAVILLAVILESKLAGNDSRAVRSTEITRVTSLTGREFLPDVSPDGDEVVFIANSDEQLVYDIYITNLDRSAASQKITDSPANELSPVWSPDGEKIAFVRYTNEGDCGIFVISRWGDDERFVTECNRQLYSLLDWSPDGRWLAYTHNDPAHGKPVPAIYLVSPDDGNRKQLTTPAGEIFGDYAPRFSEDGRTLTFLRSIREGQGALVSVDLETGREDTLFRDRQFRIRGYDRADEQGTVILSANRHGTGYGLWKYSPVEETFSTLMPGSYLYRPVVVKQQPVLKVLYEEWKLVANIHRLDVNQSGNAREEPLITSSRMDFQPSLSPGNGKIAFLSDRSGSRELWIADRDGSNLRNFQTDIELMSHAPAWSPSGEQIAFSGLTDGISQIFVADLYSNRVTQITEGQADKINPVWSKNGDTIYYSQYVSGQWDIIRQASGGGKAIPVTRDQDAIFMQESRDGKRIYYMSNTTGELFVYRPGAESRNIPDIAIDPHHNTNWRVSGENLYYFGITSGVNILDFMGITDRAIAIGMPVWVIGLGSLLTFLSWIGRGLKTGG